MNPWKLLHLLLLTAALAGYGAWLRASRAAVPPPPAVPEGALPLVRLDEARALWQRDDTLFVDVRSAFDYAFGHVAGAVSLPENEIEQRLGELRPRLERARAIVVYCKNDSCGKSLWGAIRLRNAGLTQTYIYPGGWNEWKNHDLPFATAAP